MPNRQEDLEEMLVTANTMDWLMKVVWEGDQIVQTISDEVSSAAHFHGIFLLVFSGLSLQGVGRGEVLAAGGG